MLYRFRRLLYNWGNMAKGMIVSMAFTRNPLRRLAVLKSPTVHYAGIQGSYWNTVLTTTSFATIFLLEYGITINQVGFIMAAINMLSVLMQVVLGNLVSRGKRLTLRLAVMMMCGVAAASSLTLLLILGRSQALTAALFITSAVLAVSMQPLITSMAMEYINRGYALDFSLTRGVGSVAYAVMCFALGKVIAAVGPGFLPGANVGFALLTMLLVSLFKPPAAPAHLPPPAAVEDAPAVVKTGLTVFIRKYLRFFALLGGVMCLTLCSRVISTYLIKIIEAIGGDSSTQGTAVAIGALVEFPVMAGFIRLRRRFGGDWLLRFSAVFYTVKSAAVIFSTAVWNHYLAHSIQIFGYAIFIPAFTFYINQIMEDKDRVRGQSLGVAAMTGGDVLGALLCGMIPAATPMRTVLYLALGISILGSIVVALAVKKLPEESAA